MGSPKVDLPKNTLLRHQSIPIVYTSSPFNGSIDTTISDSEYDSKRTTRGFTMPPPGSPKRGYKKPSKPREFAKSARKRQSVLALGSITHLQHFYAKRGIIIKPKKPKHVEEAEKKMNLSINTNITDLLTVTEEPDEDFPPTPLPPSPPPLPSYITSKLDVETDPEVLLATCHADIQAMIEVWCIVTGEVKSQGKPVSIDILTAIETTTKTLQSVKNYSMFKEDLSSESLSRVRAAALEVLEMISDLEKSHRDEDDSSSEDGHIYVESNYNSLSRQRDILRKYLEIVEECLLFDDLELYPPNTSYLRPSSISSEEELKQGTTPNLTPPLSPGHPNNDWVNPDVFGDDVIARYHAFFEAHRPSKSKQAPDYTPLPDPRVDKTEFLASLADGKLLCIIYNTIVRRSKRPFGFINKIHEDTSRTYRATENLKFFVAAAKFRFEIKFDAFNATEIVKLTNTGKAQLERIIEVFCEKTMQELISTGSYKQYPSSRVASMYMQDVFSSSQMQLLQQTTTNSGNGNLGLAEAISSKLSISTPDSSANTSRKNSQDSS